jgi:hypothetical protein
MPERTIPARTPTRLDRKQFALLVLADQGRLWTRNTGPGARWVADRDRYPLVTGTARSLLRRRLIARGTPNETGKILALVTERGRGYLDACAAAAAEASAPATIQGTTPCTEIWDELATFDSEAAS